MKTNKKLKKIYTSAKIMINLDFTVLTINLRGLKMATKTKLSTTSTSKKTAKRLPAVKKAMTKTELFSAIAKETDLTRKQVAAVLESLNQNIRAHLKGVGEFTLPSLLKIRVVRKEATKARKGKNPFTGEEITFKAKPAYSIPKIRALKALKEMAAK